MLVCYENSWHKTKMIECEHLEDLIDPDERYTISRNSWYGTDPEEHFLSDHSEQRKQEIREKCKYQFYVKYSTWDGYH